VNNCTAKLPKWEFRQGLKLSRRFLKHGPPPNTGSSGLFAQFDCDVSLAGSLVFAMGLPAQIYLGTLPLGSCRNVRGYMFTKSLQIGLIGFVLSVATGWAGPSSIQGVANDAKGQAIKGADVRIESRDGKKLFQTVKTDGKGRYVSSGLAAGVYRVTLTVNGAVKASIMNTKTIADQATQLNFDLKPASVSQASTAGKTGKRKVWVPSTTGSHIGGRWVEVDEPGSAHAGALNVKRGNAEDLRRQQLQTTTGGLPASSSGATSR
jgi:Carboxypeptidase regulatory-like domain